MAGTAGTGSAGSVGAGTGGGGTGGSTAGGPGTGGTGDPCPSQTNVTMATHEVLNVTWPAGPATLAGSGQVHLWGKIAFTADGNTLTGSSQACGTVLPPTELNPVIGGGKILIEVPATVWDAAATTSRVQVDATQSGWNVGSTFSYMYTASIGFTPPAPATGAWPASYSALTMTTDFDGDGKPGLTGVPRNGNGYLLPPSSALGALGPSPRADKLYLVDRNVASAMLTRTSCDEASGTATFMHFDNHVVGCHVSGGAECTPTEVQFIDDNRTVYTVTSATTKAKVVPDGTTCATIVKDTLPM